MNKFFILPLILFSTVASAECNPNSKKVVIYMGYHASDVEVTGAESACKKGERVIIVPDETYFKEYTKLDQRVEEAQKQLNAANKIENNNCIGDRSLQSCASASQKADDLGKKLTLLSNDRDKWLNEHPYPDGAFNKTVQSLNEKGASIDSVIISGHDGGGHFYGDIGGGTTKEDIFETAEKYPAQFKNTKSVILMGCWSSVPDQAQTWKAHLPSLKVIAGFGGSAPSAVQKAGGEYIAGILNAEDDFAGTTEQQALAKLKAIADINYITAAVFVDPTKNNCTFNGKAYYALFADNESEVNKRYKKGINDFKIDTDASREARCENLNEDPDFWNRLDVYMQGRREPTNNADLTGLYDTLRHNEDCFEYNHMDGRVSPNQALMLRFFQDVKKNFGKYFKKEITEAYAELDDALAHHSDVLSENDKSAFGSTMRLSEDSLSKLNRMDTIQAISDVERATGLLASNNLKYSALARLASLSDTYLYEMKCLDDTWHQYGENARLVPPTCQPDPYH